MIPLLNRALSDIPQSYLSPQVIRALPWLVRLAHKIKDSLEQDKTLPKGFREERQSLLRQLNARQYIAGMGNAYQFPYLSHALCDMLSLELRRHPFNPNEDEDPQVQMPESVLQYTCPELYESLTHLHDMVLEPLWVVLTGHSPTEHASCQVAKYRAGEHSCSDWHTDEDSEFTTTVLLSRAGEYVGGGMQLFPGVQVGRGLLGDATLFQGKRTMHRSLPILEGERTILVHWVNAV